MPVMMGHAGMVGMPALSEDMLKVHIEWQIESLQNLLKQIEARQKEKGNGGGDGDQKPDAKPSGD